MADDLPPDRLPGGAAGGAALVRGTVRRAVGPWTPAVHALLLHLQQRGFGGAPHALGMDEQGRETLSYLPGESIGDRKPWPEWVHSDHALVEVARWLRAYHQAVADFRPPTGAVWREGGSWVEGMIIGHNDAAPYNACWDRRGRLVGFFDWDLAGPQSITSDLAAVAFSWVPLHARRVVEAEGFTEFDRRLQRLSRFLDAYGWSGTARDLLPVVRDRAVNAAAVLRRTANRGDPTYEGMVAMGRDRDLETAAAEIDDLLDSLSD